MRAAVLVVSKVDIIIADSDLITAVNMSLAARFVGNAQPLTMKLLKYLVIHSTLYNCYFSCPGQSHTARTSDKIKCACNEEITLAGELNTRPGIFRGAEVKKCQFKCPFHFLDAFVTSTDICLEHLVFIVSITRGCIFASAGQRTERFQFLELSFIHNWKPCKKISPKCTAELWKQYRTTDICCVVPKNNWS